MNETLYKYRSLDNFKNFVDIILKNRLYAARYKDLNDPMEGQYYYNRGELRRNIREKLRDQKEELRICSLTPMNNNELMWSHYANSQKGVAIGVLIDPLKNLIRDIQYDGIHYLRDNDYNNHTAMEILCHKLEVWSYEKEKRVFTSTKQFIDVKVKEVVLGRSMSNQDISLVSELVNSINPGITIIRAKDIMDN